MSAGGPKRYDIRNVTNPELSLQTVTKTEDGEKDTEYFEAPFEPYCYVEHRPDDKEYHSELARALGENGCIIEDEPSGEIAETGNPGIKVTAQSPWDIRDFKYSFDYETYEADVPYTRRVMIDMDLTVDIPDWEDILYFDIEVDPRGEFPDPDEAKKQIISIAGVDGTGEEFFICYDDEERILREFRDLLDDYFIVVGWNSGTFDWPYIKARMDLMPFDIDYFKIIHFDLQYLMMHVNREERPSWALDDVGADEVGMEKTMSEEDHEMGYEVLWHWYENDRETLEEYNVEDCKIVKEIDRKYTLIRLIFRICRRGYARPSEIMYRDDSNQVRIAVGKACDSVVLSVAQDYIFNDQYKYADLHDFPGGKVFDPIPGTYNNVMTADFSGMYPAIIKDFNIGPNTWIDTNDQSEAVEMAQEMWPEEDIDEDDLISGAGPHGVGEKARGFFIDPDIERSILAEAIDEVEDLRMEYKSKKKDQPKGTPEWHKYNNIDRGLKVLMNTFYGIFASPKKRYYIPGMSENVTEIGQHLISTCFSWARENVAEVEKPIYGDTDSVMLELNLVDADFDESEYKAFVADFIDEVESEGNNKLDMDSDEIREAFEIVQVARRGSQKLNEFIVEYVQEEHNSPGNNMKMDLDDVWRNYLITNKKKKYAGEVVYDDGPCAYKKIKGFKCIKANTSEAVKQFQKTLIDAKLHDKPTTHILDEYKHKLFTGQFDEEMIQWTRLNKMPSEYSVLQSHSRAAKMMIEREGDKGAVRTGDKIQYLKYGDDTMDVEPTDNGIEDRRPNEHYCPECDEVIMGEHDHETIDGPRLRPRHYSYLWDKRFGQTMELLQVSRHEQTGLEAFA